jgi:glycosyltransferase involved in cell wall biosynthesis
VSEDLLNTITVVIPTFNRRQLLQTALESVLKETRVPIRVHVLDNASTDDTTDYIRSVAAQDQRIYYFKNDHNIGMMSNYCLGLGSVKTEYYVPLADDDWLLPNFIYDASRILKEHPDVGAAIFVTEARNEKDEVQFTFPSQDHKIRLGLLKPSEHLHDWMTFGHYGWSSILWRAATLRRIGPPYLHVGLPSDVDFQAQIFCEFSVYIVNQPGAVFRLHGGQASRGFDISYLWNWALLFRRLDRKVNELGIIDRLEYRRLKQVMQSRYRWAWQTPTKSTLSKQQVVRMASLAGFRLNDWDFAFSLLDRLVSVSQRETQVKLFDTGDQSTSSDTRSKARDLNITIQGRTGVLLSIMLTLKDMREK